MRVTIKGQVTIPKDIRDHLGIKPGSEVEFMPRADGKVELLRTGGNKARERSKSIRSWAERVRGAVDSNGMTPDEYYEWMRGPRDDLGSG
ncbi:MAG: AbrB/MazE/SpoVT family DNA-binding domain-containing protein [Rhizobiaceae bacterium]|nr:AbrB/MazE/SpoVT family DNA-binding domain-containing protein [Rhizobiaceae bacterium]